MGYVARLQTVKLQGSFCAILYTSCCSYYTRYAMHSTCRALKINRSTKEDVERFRRANAFRSVMDPPAMCILVLKDENLCRNIIANCSLNSDGQTCRHPPNRKYIAYHSATNGEPSHGMGTGNMHRKFGEVDACGF